MCMYTGITEVGSEERETEVVVLAARGLSNRQIARELHISPANATAHPAKRGDIPPSKRGHHGIVGG
jgi:FixJ family two-component response regulator